MAANRARERYPDNDLLTDAETRERRSDGAERRSRNESPQGGTRRGAPNTGRRQSAGRHEAAAPRPVKRRPTARERRWKRRIRSLLLLLLALGTIAVLTNLIAVRAKNFKVSSSTTNQQVLSWKKSLGVDSYEIYDGSGTLLAEVDAGDGTQYTVNGLESGTRYTYSIIAVKDLFGKHPGEAVECSAFTMPEAVRAVTVTNSGTGAFLLWDSGDVSGYEIQYADASGTVQTAETRSSGAEGLNIPDLQEGVQYTFQIRSFMQDGESRIYSDWISSEPLTALHTADMTGIDIEKPMVALTFDDGPDYEDVTERILDTLKEYGGHASFFQLGDRASVLPGLMTRIAAEGHEIACHTYDHTHYGSDVTADDIIHGDDAIEQACGKRPSAFRSPGGDTTDLIREVCASEGMPIFSWSLDTADWKSRDADAVYDAVMNNVSDGDIILMHNIYSSTADAVERFVPRLVEMGYQLVTVSQLVQAKTGQPPVPGTQYITATSTK